jgi:hypothetical protein
VRLASDYDELFALVTSRLESSPPGEFADVGTAAAKTPDGADASDTDSAGTDSEAGAAADTAQESLTIVGLNAQSKTTTDGQGHSFIVAGEELKVREDSSGKVVATLSLYDSAKAGGEALCVVFSQNTLAVLYATDAGYNYRSTDLALAAYGAPRTTALFFDATEPADLSLVSAVGISGVPQAVALSANSICVATSHKTAYEVGADGLWMTKGDGARNKGAIKASLDLRRGSQISYTPSYFADDTLVPLKPAQLYLSEYGYCTTATVFASFSLAKRDCATLFALYDPAPGAGQKNYSVRTASDNNGAPVPTGLLVHYTLDYQGAAAVMTTAVAIADEGIMPGITEVFWSEPE